METLRAMTALLVMPGFVKGCKIERRIYFSDRCRGKGITCNQSMSCSQPGVPRNSHVWTKIPADQQRDFCPKLPPDASQITHLQEAASAAARH